MIKKWDRAFALPPYKYYIVQLYRRFKNPQWRAEFTENLLIVLSGILLALFAYLGLWAVYLWDLKEAEGQKDNQKTYQKADNFTENRSISHQKDFGRKEKK